MSTIAFRFFGVATLLTIAVLAGRLSGFFRELLLAGSFGISSDADVAVIVLTLPDLLVNILISGGLSVALVPAFQKINIDLKGIFFAQVSFVVLIAFGLISFFLLVFPEAFFGVLAPGMIDPAIKLNPIAMLSLALSLPLAALSGVSSAALNSAGRFFVAGCGTLIFNLCVIVSIVISFNHHQIGLILLSIGVAIGALLRLGSQWLQLAFMINITTSRVFRCWLVNRNLINAFIAGLSATSILVLIPVVIRAAASLIGEGELSAFNYAMKLVEFPVGIFIATVSTIMYPQLISAIDQGSGTEAGLIVKVGILKSFIFSVSVLLCGWNFGDSAVNLLFGFGRITQQEREHVADLVKISLLSLPWIGIVSVMSVAANAKGQHGLVLKLNFYAFLVLPLLLMPGVILSSPLVLLASQPFFYILLTFLFYRLSDIKEFAAFPASVFKASLIMFTVFMPFVFIDRMGGNFFDLQPIEYDVCRILIAATSWVVVVYTGFRVLNLIKINSCKCSKG